jgi:hypothetical protein
MRVVSITIGKYTVATTEEVARQIAADPELLLKTWEFAREAAQTLRDYNGQKEEE